MATPSEEYERRLRQRTATLTGRQRQHIRLSNLRLAVFGASGAIAWLAFGVNRLSPAWLLVAAAAFLGLVVAHARVLNSIERGERARRLYERGLDRLRGRWTGTGADGRRFEDGHPYARDLDLFGPASLFQLLNTARTEAGEERLAGWLSRPAGIPEIIARQAAVDELRPELDFREDLTVLAAEAHVGRTAALMEWAATAPSGLTGPVAAMLAGSATISSLLAGLALAGWLGVEWAASWLLVQGGLAYRWRRQVVEVTSRIDTPAHDLLLLQNLMERLERQTFSSPRLSELHAVLLATGRRPSQRIRQLRSIVSILDSAENPYFQLSGLAYLLMIRSQAAVAIDRWHAAHGAALRAWLHAVGEFEALSALATYAYEHPGDPFPSLVTDGPFFDAVQLSHPLIVEAQAVSNDVRLGADAPRVLVVSGSNMSGKSTLLRAVGVNVVLALAGAPVRASRLVLSPLAIGATLRFEDSLVEKRSRFYAEIVKLRAIVDVAEGPTPALFLLDEILHGTNSHDRRLGAGAVVRALLDAGAIGLVTTHDLALAELVEALPGRAANVHFEDRLEAGEMVFDYRMRPGVVTSGNALALMRAIGLRV